LASPPTDLKGNDVDAITKSGRGPKIKQAYAVKESVEDPEALAARWSATSSSMPSISTGRST
jgi:hypothetical protein